MLDMYCLALAEWRKRLSWRLNLFPLGVITAASQVIHSMKVELWFVSVADVVRYHVAQGGPSVPALYPMKPLRPPSALAATFTDRGSGDFRRATGFATRIKQLYPELYGMQLLDRKP
jgi:hypothetical protein